MKILFYLENNNNKTTTTATLYLEGRERCGYVDVHIHVLFTMSSVPSDSTLDLITNFWLSYFLIPQVVLGSD